MIQSQLQPSNLEALWLQVLEQLHPPVLRALFQQKAALLTFNGANACIGMPSPPLARLAQKSLQNVASAFNRVLHQEIHVSIRVTATPASIQTEPFIALDNTASHEVRFPDPSFSVPGLEAGLGERVKSGANNWDLVSEEEVLAAAQSLAAFFDGEVISVPDDWTL